MLYISITTAIAASVGFAVWLYWRARKKPTSEMVSLVALLREPVVHDPLVLAKTAGRAWNADLGDGTESGADGFVAGHGPFNMIVHNNRPYMFHCMPQPYVHDLEAAAESIGDLRIRRLFCEHKAWFSCDAMDVDASSPAGEITDRYRRLARLFAAFLDENCLLIYVPDTCRAYAINDETERALQSDDPLGALQQTQTLPVISVSDDDPRMAEAVTKARESWPQFVTAFESAAGENFSVKAPVTYADTTEYIWLTVTAVEGDRICGTLGNDPANLGPLTLGSKVSVSLSELNDWCYIDLQGNLHGGFTIAVVQAASQRH